MKDPSRPAAVVPSRPSGARSLLAAALLLPALAAGCQDGGSAAGELSGEAAAPAAAGSSADRADASIIVSGASGQLGGIVVEELLAGGVDPENLILVSRTPEELDEYARMGAATRFGDFTRPESLDEAYAGGDRILIISLNTRGNPNPVVSEERPRLHQTAIDAAVDAGVDHIVYTSFVDAEDNPSPIAVDHRLTEEMLRESGVGWTALRNQWYADRLVQEAARMVSEGRAVVNPDQDGTAFIARADCAAAAAAVLMEPEGHENRVYEITGPELIRGADVAAAAEEITGVPIEVVDAGPGDEPAVADLDSGTTLTDHFERITGRPATGLRGLLEAHRDVLMEAAGAAETAAR